MSDRRGHLIETLRRVERHVRWSAVLYVPLAISAVVDLTTGSPYGDWHVDAAILVLTGMILWAFVSLSSLRQRALDTAGRDQRRGPVIVIRSIAMTGLSFALTAVVGYLLGGWRLAGGLAAVTAATVALGVGLGLRRRRKIRAGAP